MLLRNFVNYDVFDFDLPFRIQNQIAVTHLTQKIKLSYADFIGLDKILREFQFAQVTQFVVSSSIEHSNHVYGLFVILDNLELRGLLSWFGLAWLTKLTSHQIGWAVVVEIGKQKGVVAAYVVPENVDFVKFEVQVFDRRLVAIQYLQIRHFALYLLNNQLNSQVQ